MRAGFDPAIVWAVWMRNFTVYRRTWVMNILPNFFEPLLYLVGLGLGLGAYLEGPLHGPAYVAFIGPGLMAAAAMNGASFETTYNMFVRMTFSRLYEAYLGTPALVQDVVLGELLWATTRALAYGCAFLLVLLGFDLAGYRVVTSWWALALPPVLALIGACFALIGQCFTSLIRVIDLYAYYYTLFLTPLFLFSGIFFHVSRFPFGEQIAWCTPLYHSVRLCRGLSQGAVGLEQLVSALWLLGVSAVLFAIVPRRLRERLVR
ncbi:MAG: ABC transporter permease [Planctomycetota bacterium]|nr:MAG: ABC transporter permease [Planctomycetota bacterium]